MCVQTRLGYKPSWARTNKVCVETKLRLKQGVGQSKYAVETGLGIGLSRNKTRLWSKPGLGVEIKDRVETKLGSTQGFN